MSRRKMMRLAVVAVAACVAAVAIAPGTALAASEITLKSGAKAPSPIYAGHSYTLKLAGQNVKWKVSDKKIATIGSITGKLKPTVPGKVTVTALSRKSGKKLATKSFKVLQRATKITATPTEICLKAVGDTAMITAKKTPATSSDLVCFFSSKSRIAQVNLYSGKVTAKSKGTCEIKVISKATKAYPNNHKYNKVTYVTVYVGPCLTTAEHDGIRIFATLKNAPDNVKPEDFSLLNEETKAQTPIASVEQDGEQIALTTSTQLEEGQTFRLVYGNTAVRFTAAWPKVNAVKLVPDTVIAGIKTPVIMQLVTSKGSVIATSDLGGGGLNGKYGTGYTASVKLSTDDGYFNRGISTIYLPQVGDTVAIEVTKHTGTYEDGKEVGVEKWKAVLVAREANADETGLSEAAQSVRCVDYGSSATITAWFAKKLQNNLKASDFILKPKDGGDPIAIDSTNSRLAETRLSLYVASSALTDGKVYELYTTKEPFTKKLGEFTFVKYVYVAPTPPTDPPTTDKGGEIQPPTDTGSTPQSDTK